MLSMAGTAGSVVASDRFVDATTGVDVPGGGGVTTPWKTLSFASKQVSAGDALHIAAGIYDEAGNGEVFPVNFYQPVSLLGASSSQVTITASRGGIDHLISVYPAIPGQTLVVSGLRFDGAGVVVRGLFVPFGSPAGGAVRVTDSEFRGFRGTDGNGYTACGIEYGVSAFVGPLAPESIVDLTVDRNRFIDNESGIKARYFFVGSTGLTTVIDRSLIQNNVFLDNSSGVESNYYNFESDVSMLGAQSRILNNVFARNRTGVTSSLSHWYGQFEISNNIFALQSDVGIDVPIRSMAANLYFDNTMGLARISGAPLTTIAEVNNWPGHDPAFPSVAGDPQFVDLSTGDVHLLSGSPAIDKGMDPGAPPFDIDGDGRPQDGDGDSIAVSDIGADEFPAPPSTSTLMRAIRSGLPLLPALSDIHPFAPTNPLTPVIEAQFSAPFVDIGILGDLNRPMVLYQTDSLDVIYAIKDTITDAVVLSRR